jgi:hypothetical protein
MCLEIGEIGSKYGWGENRHVVGVWWTIRR